jgi:hypothetical protein
VCSAGVIEASLAELSADTETSLDLSRLRFDLGLNPTIARVIGLKDAGTLQISA